MVLPLIINAAIFASRYSTILQSLAVGSLGLTIGGGDLAYCLLCISILGYSVPGPGLEKSLGEKPWGNGSPGNPKLGGRESIEAMETMETPEGAREGGLEAGDRELSLSGDLEPGPRGPGGEESLNWERSVGAGGAGIEIIFVSTPCNITMDTAHCDILASNDLTVESSSVCDCDD